MKGINLKINHYEKLQLLNNEGGIKKRILKNHK